MGLIGSALPMFEELELWDSLIVCYRMLGKAPQAEALINARLRETPDDGRLWCSLGDLRLDDGCYREAWSRSGQRSARAQRSLARSAMRRRDYAASVGHWEAALALNPLNPDGWFALGFACLKANDTGRAAQAFTRAVQQEPDNGDAWANVAALHLQKRSWGPAFSAAAEAVKFKRESWQMWSNYALAAARTGHHLKALRGAQQVLQLTGGQKLETEVLESLIEQLASALASAQDAGADVGSSASAQPAAAAADAARPAASGAGPAGPETLPARSAHTDDAAAATGAAQIGGVGESASGVAALSLEAHAAGDGEDAEEGAEAAEVDAVPPPLTARDVAQLRGGLSQVLKSAAGGAAGDSALWGLLAKYYTVTGETASAREALIKWTRALQGTPWRAEQEAFEVCADATLRLAGFFAGAAEAGNGSVRDLSSGRLQLRGILKQTEERFGATPAFADLAAALERLETLLAEAKAEAAE